MNCGTASGHKADRMHSRNTVSTTCIAMFEKEENFSENFSFFLPKDVAMPGKNISVTRRTPNLFPASAASANTKSTVLGISFREKLSSASKKLREAAGDVRGKAAPLREKLTSLHVKGIHKENAERLTQTRNRERRERKARPGVSICRISLHRQKTRRA